MVGGGGGGGGNHSSLWSVSQKVWGDRAWTVFASDRQAVLHGTSSSRLAVHQVEKIRSEWGTGAAGQLFAAAPATSTQGLLPHSVTLCRSILAIGTLAPPPPPPQSPCCRLCPQPVRLKQSLLCFLSKTSFCCCPQPNVQCCVYFMGGLYGLCP